MNPGTGTFRAEWRAVNHFFEAGINSSVRVSITDGYEGNMWVLPKKMQYLSTADVALQGFFAGKQQYLRRVIFAGKSV